MAISIEDIIQTSRDYADSTYNLAIDLLDDAAKAADDKVVYGIGSLDFSPTVKGTIAADPIGDFSDRYNAPTNDTEVPDFEPLFVPTIPSDWGTPPDSLDTSDLFKQPVPVYDILPFSGTAPEIDPNFTIPPTPSIGDPQKPELTQITVDDAPTVTIPTFDEDFLLSDPDQIEDLAARYKAEYGTVLPEMRDFIDSMVDEWVDRFSPEYRNGLAQLEEKLASGMPGGQALSDEVEQSIYDKARARVQAERINSEAQLLNSMAKRGFDLPPGAVAGGLQQIAADSARNNAMSATETAIERAKMEIQHVQFVMQQANYLRQFMQNLAMQRAQQIGQVNQQAMNYANEIAQLILGVYEAELKRYSAAMEIYKTHASVYEIRIKSSLAELEAYKIEVEGKKLQGDLQKLQVDMYATEINAEKAKIELFLAELQGVTTQAQLEKVKAEIFGEQINAYLGEVKAKTAEFDAYKSAISGDSAKIDAYISQVNAYRTEVDAAKARLSGDVAYAESISAHNRNLTEQFKAELLGYTSEIDAEKTRFAASAEAYKTGLEAYKTELSAELDVLRSKLAEDELNLKALMAKKDVMVKDITLKSEMFQERVRLMATTATESSSIASNIASAALNSNNSMVQAVL